MISKGTVCFILCGLIVTLVSVSCVSNDRGIVLSEQHLETSSIQDFVLVEEDILQVLMGEKLFAVDNVVLLDKNQDDIIYFFLSTQEEKRQILVVLNNNLQKVQWGSYYTEHCYFDPVELVAIVAEPFPERHQSVVMKVHDFNIDNFYTTETDLSFTLGTSEGDKQAYYQVPKYKKSKFNAESSAWYTIFWMQAHYSFYDNKYTVDDKYRGGISISRDSSTLDELEPLEYTMDGWEYPTDYSPLSRNLNGVYETVIMSPKNEDPSWDNYQIYTKNNSTGETSMISFGTVFRYQDPLISITPAKNKDNRVAFIVETKEFTYDFYYDPEGITTDSFLRPSSYKRIYLK